MTTDAPPLPAGLDRRSRATGRDPRGPAAPVVSVGNLAMGGRGKTPLVALAARLLVEAGERPAILSRGYRRRRPEEGAVIVSDGVHLCADLDRSGDEPLMLARAAPGAAVLVCEIRAVAAALAERTLGSTVHLLDDGFQHRSLRRDIDIVVVAPEDLDGRRVPFGTLRSPVSSLARADAVVVDNDASGEAAERVGRLVRAGARVFTMTRSLGEPRRLEPERPRLARGVPVLAVAGIAEPARFGRALVAAGWRVVEARAFPDHHAYTRRDAARIAAAMRAAGADAVVTTEKDAVRLLPLRPLPFAAAAMPLEIRVDPAGEFRQWLLAAVRGCRIEREAGA